MRKNILHYLVAFILPILIFGFAMFSLNIYPFGDISIRFSDALYQYPAFFEGLKNFNIFTFNIGLGESFYPIFTTYLNNPLNLLYFFFKKENFDLFYIILILIKFGLMGLTMNIMLNYKKKISGNSLIFSTIYALSGFTTFYYWNYQFLDAMYILPLIMIGIDKIVNDDKNLMYYIFLTYMIIIHYYTAYMICLFSVIYFFYLLYNSNYEKKIKKQRTAKFFITSLFCGLTASYIIIPTIFSLLQGRTSYIGNTNLWGINKVFLSSLFNFTMGSTYIKESINLVNSSNMYISVFVFLLVIISIFYSKTNIKYKKSTVIVILIYLLSLALNPLYFIWHLFQQPVGIPSRFIFCFNAFLVLIAYNFFNNKSLQYKKISKKVIILIIVFVLGTFAFKYYHYIILNNKVNILKTSLDKVYTYMLILNIIIILFYIWSYNKSKAKYITYFVIIIELSINSIMNINVNQQNVYYRYTYVSEEKQKIKDIEKKVNELKSDEFQRIHTTLNKNGGLLYNFYGVSRYSSIYNNNIVNLLENFRESNEHKHSLKYNNMFLMDALLGVKYVINESKESFSANKYVINSLGFLISNQNIENNNDIVKTLNCLTNNKYQLELNDLNPKKYYENVVEIDEWYELEDESKDGKVVLTYNIDENIIGEINFLDDYVIYITDDNNIIQEIVNYKDTYKMYLNNKEVYDIYDLKKGDVLKIEMLLNPKKSKTYKFDSKLKYVNEEKFKKLINDLNSNLINDIKINSNGFEGNVSVVDEKDLLVLTIPYDEGIEIKIDGKKTDYTKFMNSIISLKLPKGDHKIEMFYHIKGLTIGIIISIISFIGFIVYYFNGKNVNNV